jgi:hypothetical protein
MAGSPFVYEFGQYILTTKQGQRNFSAVEKPVRETKNLHLPHFYLINWKRPLSTG